MYVEDGKAKFAYNYFDLNYYYVEASKKLPDGKVNVRYHFDFDGGQPGAGGTGRLFVNDEQVGEGRIEKTVPSLFSADETMDIGIDTATPVTSDYPEAEANAFQGEIDWVRIDLEDDDVSHLVPEEVLYHSAIGRQQRKRSGVRREWRVRAETRLLHVGQMPSEIVTSGGGV